MTSAAEVPETSPTPPRRAYLVEEFAQLTGMKPDHVRRSIHKGEIKATKIGALYFISSNELERLFGTAA